EGKRGFKERRVLLRRLTGGRLRRRPSLMKLDERAERFPQWTQLALAKGRIETRHAASRQLGGQAAPSFFLCYGNHREVHEDLAAVGAQLRVQSFLPGLAAVSEV